MKEIATKEQTNVITTESSTILEVISKAASDPNTDVDKLERMMSMYERMEAKKAENAYNQAMASAQSKIRPVAADATNPQTRSNYASYAALDKALRPIYSRHGFALSFDTGEGAPENWVRVICHVSHIGGHSRTHHIDMPADGKGAKGGDVMTKTHATGSAMSYGMRYLLKLIFNVAVGEDDDDGNAASVETITEEQLADLKALMEEVNADEKQFCKVCKVDSLSELPMSKYQGAIDLLETKRKK